MVNVSGAQLSVSSASQPCGSRAGLWNASVLGASAAARLLDRRCGT